MDTQAPSPEPLADGPLPALRARIRAGALHADPSQLLAAERLQGLWSRLRGYDPPPLRADPAGGMLGRLLRRRPAEGADEARLGGLYLVGDVGRGKSMLMDLFFGAASLARKRRVHFHAFMQEAHRRIHAWRGAHPDGADPIPPLADALAGEAALLCLDELQITDIADALILGRLFEALFARGVVVVATSNTSPGRLFEGQPGRDAFLPFIALLQQHLDLLVLDGPRDFRRGGPPVGSRWLVPADADARKALDAAFNALAGGAPLRAERLTVMGRRLDVPHAAGVVARFDFAGLCGSPLGAGDYLALATHFDALVLDDVPRLGGERRDETRRFIVLVDALYEHRVQLVASAAAAPDALCVDGDWAAAFARTASRLVEMQGTAWAGMAHLT